MKKLLMAVAVVSAAFLTSCGGGANGKDPKAVLMAFFDALSKKDIAGARKYATAESKSMLDMMETAAKLGGDKKDDGKYDKTKMEFGEPKIDGDKATIEVKEKEGGDVTNFTLKKESGDWKVAFDKSSMMNMGMDKMKNAGENGMDKVNEGLDKVKDMNLDSLGDKVKEGLNKLNENKDKIEEALKQLKQ
jgi:hypothetical protein